MVCVFVTKFLQVFKVPVIVAYNEFKIVFNIRVDLLEQKLGVASLSVVIDCDFEQLTQISIFITNLFEVGYSFWIA